MLRTLALVLAFLTLPTLATAQGANIAFGGSNHDSSQPVEIAADELSIDQTSGFATFTGNVIAAQGDLRLSAPRVEVEYEDNGGDVKVIRASGGVTFTSAEEAAEAQSAIFTPSTSTMVMTGDVVVTQGQNALAGQKLTLNVDDGTGVMSGRVRTIFQQGGN